MNTGAESCHGSSASVDSQQLQKSYLLLINSELRALLMPSFPALSLIQVLGCFSVVLYWRQNPLGTRLRFQKHFDHDPTQCLDSASPMHFALEPD